MLNSHIKILIALITVALVSLLTGCGSATPVPAKQPTPIPAWVNSILPNDTNEKIYGMSTGKNRESAINAALADMIARLGTTIESSYKSNQKVHNSLSSLDVEYDIKADVSKIKVNNYKVIKYHKLSYKEYAVMIETDKQKFIRGLRDDLEIKEKEINKRYEALKHENILTKYNVKKELALSASKLMSIVLILAELDATFEKKGHEDFIMRKQKEFVSQSSKLQFYVEGNGRSTLFIDKIKNYLAASGFKVSNSKNNSVLVKLHTTDNVSNNKLKIAVLTLKISVHENSNRIGGKSVIIKERYNNSIGSVYKNASVHFEQDIKNQGINKLIGINLNI